MAATTSFGMRLFTLRVTHEEDFLSVLDLAGAFLVGWIHTANDAWTDLANHRDHRHTCHYRLRDMVVVFSSLEENVKKKRLGDLSLDDMMGADVSPESAPILMKGKRAHIPGEYLEDKPMILAEFNSRIEGPKRWVSGEFAFDATQFNLDLFTKLFGGPKLEAPARFEAPAPVHTAPVECPKDFKFKTKPYDLQLRAFNAARGKNRFSLFMEMGTGKTKVALDLAADHFLRGDIQQVLVFAPKGVHSQWTESTSEKESALQEHCVVPYDKATWPFKELPKPARKKLQVVSFNRDALIHDKPFAMMMEYVSRAPTFIIPDESHNYANAGSQRSKQLLKLCLKAWGVLLLTGTPVFKNLVNLWAQFKLLDERIIGHRYVTTFRSQYCIMGGFEQRQVVGSKNVDHLMAKVDPYIFRASKDELGLPPKIFSERVFEMSKAQAAHYNSLKKEFLTQFKDGTNLTVANAAVMIMRLQQIACGYLSMEGHTEEIEDARLPALMEIIEQREGPMVIWCRFRHDVERIVDALEGQAVSYYGGNTQAENDYQKSLYLGGHARFFVGTPDKGGTGVDGLQKRTRTIVYYSNSFSSQFRWQSEDRTNRIGMHGDSMLYIDLIARGTVDRRIKQVLQRDAQLRDRVMDVTTKLSLRDLEQMIMGDM